MESWNPAALAPNLQGVQSSCCPIPLQARNRGHFGVQWGLPCDKQACGRIGIRRVSLGSLPRFRHSADGEGVQWPSDRGLMEMVIGPLLPHWKLKWTPLGVASGKTVQGHWADGLRAKRWSGSGGRRLEQSLVFNEGGWRSRLWRSIPAQNAELGKRIFRRFHGRDP